MTEEEEIKSTKDLLESIKNFKKDNGGKISMDLFNKIGQLKFCKAPEDKEDKMKMTHCLNANMIGRIAIEINEKRKDKRHDQN